MRSVVQKSQSKRWKLICTAIKAADSIRRFNNPLTDDASVRRLLFLNHSPALGTCLNGSPVFEAFKQAIPECQIAVACSGIGYEVVRHSPFVDFAWKTVSSDKNLIGSARDLRRALKQKGFKPDWVFTDSWNQRAKTVLLGALAGNFRRAGFATYPPLLDRSLTYDRNLSIVDNNLKLLMLFGKQVDHIEPRMFYSADDLEKVSQMLNSETPPERPRVVLTVISSGTAPVEWIDDRFAAIGNFLHNDLNFSVLFVGTARQAPEIERIRKLMSAPSVSLVGKTSIGRLAAVLASSDVGVGIDSGPMHLARAVRLPFVLISSAFEPAVTWLPLNQPQIEILRRPEIECRICGKAFCKTRVCMEQITVPQVMGAIQSILAKYPPSLGARAQRTKNSLGRPDKRTA